MIASLLRRAALGLTLAGLLLVPATAVAAPRITGANGEVWNASRLPVTYTITGTREGAEIQWSVLRASGATLVPPVSGQGPSPVTVTLADPPQGSLQLVAAQTSPRDRGRATRRFTVDTVPPTITVSTPSPDAAYEQGQRVLADFACGGGAQTCEGSVADGAPLDTSSPGDHELVVTAGDEAGNSAVRRVAYSVTAPGSPPPPPPATTSGTPEGPTPAIRLAPEDPQQPSAERTPATLTPARLKPAAGATVRTGRPVLEWARVRGATLYNLQIYRLDGNEATKIVSRFPRGTRLRVPSGELRYGRRYVWRVWPLVRGSYPGQPLGVSWFDVERPVKLTAGQLLVNQRISQAAIRRLSAIAAWLDAGLVTGDLRDGGLGPQEFGADVTLSGGGTAIENGFASPRPLDVAQPRRARAPRLRVTARQLLVNQRIGQAAVRRANALEARLGGGLTGGDLRPGAVGPTKLAPGVAVARAEPALPAPAASTTAIPSAGGRTGDRVTPTARQLLINQRISQAAVRRANGMADLIEAGLTGDSFRDGAITAVSIAPQLR